MKKCSVEGCDNDCNSKIFLECDYHISKSFHEINRKVVLEAFPEINGMPYKKPVNKYAKFLRDCADRDLFTKYEDDELK